jgi:enterochelin esterase family protein
VSVPAAGTLRDDVVLRYDDPEGRLGGVRLVCELYKREAPRAFERVAGGWALRLPDPGVDRFEYQLELLEPLELVDGGDRPRTGTAPTRRLVADPRAPTVPGPFGDKSEARLAGYAPPAWTLASVPGGTLRPLELPCRGAGRLVEGLLWSPPGSDPSEPLPLLLVHDGPEYAAYARLPCYLDVATVRGELPPLRAALLAPVRRNEDYSASARYTGTLVRDLLPALAELAPSPPGRTHRAALGASLGAVALLHAHRLHPDAFGALFLQSGSFFRRQHDALERGFPRFGRIVRFVGAVRAAATWPEPVPVVLTCGTAEENLGSNRALARSLAAQGYDVDLVETRDGHNWVSWRDALHPHLARLLRRVFS